MTQMAGMPCLKLSVWRDVRLRLRVRDRIQVGLECPQDVFRHSSGAWAGLDGTAGSLAATALSPQPPDMVRSGHLDLSRGSRLPPDQSFQHQGSGSCQSLQIKGQKLGPYHRHNVLVTCPQKPPKVWADTSDLLKRKV